MVNGSSFFPTALVSCRDDLPLEGGELAAKDAPLGTGLHVMPFQLPDATMSITKKRAESSLAEVMCDSPGCQSAA